MVDLENRCVNGHEIIGLPIPPHSVVEAITQEVMHRKEMDAVLGHETWSLSKEAVAVGCELDLYFPQCAQSWADQLENLASMPPVRTIGNGLLLHEIIASEQRQRLLR